MCASLIGKLLGCGVATTVIKSVVQNVEENENFKVQLEDYFKSVENPFSDLYKGCHLFPQVAVNMQFFDILPF